MEIRVPTKEEFRLVYERDMKTAFPPEELKPLQAIERLWDAGIYRKRFGEEKYKKFFNIPWDPSMGMPERVLWEE